MKLLEAEEALAFNKAEHVALKVQRSKMVTNVKETIGQLNQFVVAEVKLFQIGEGLNVSRLDLFHTVSAHVQGGDVGGCTERRDGGKVAGRQVDCGEGRRTAEKPLKNSSSFLLYQLEVRCNRNCCQISHNWKTPYDGFVFFAILDGS